MFDETAIQKAVEEDILSLTGVGFVWANAHGDGARNIPERPYLDMQLIPTGVADNTVARTAPSWNGTLQVTVVMEQGKFETDGKAIRKQVGDLYPAARRITAEDGTSILLPEHPQPGPAYVAGGDYRLPVLIQITTE